MLAFLVTMTYVFTGLFRLFIFFPSNVVDRIAPIAGIHITHSVGVLMLPLILRYIQCTGTLILQIKIMPAEFSSGIVFIKSPSYCCSD